MSRDNRGQGKDLACKRRAHIRALLKKEAEKIKLSCVTIVIYDLNTRILME